MVTMKDVAEAVGASQAAVSYAYNHPSKLSDERREQILAKANELGYPGPTSSQRRSGSAQVGALGLMVMDTLSYAFDDASNVLLIKGLVEVGELAQVALTLLPLDYAGHKLGDQEQLTSWISLIDGLVIHSLPENDPVIESLVERLPVVIVDSPQIPGVPFVGIRDRSAAGLAMEHLLTLGHTRIGILVDRLVPDGTRGIVPLKRLRAAVDRVARERVFGYLDSIEAIGLDTETVPIIEAGGFSYGSAMQAAERLLGDHDLTAIIAVSDALAYAVLDICADQRIDVPEEFSVVGFDDGPNAAQRGLTTVRNPMVDKGRHAARMLLQRVNGGNRQQIILPTELVVRTTTAPPFSGRRPHALVGATRQ